MSVLRLPGRSRRGHHVASDGVRCGRGDAATPDATAAGAQNAGVTPNANLDPKIQVGEGFKIVASLRGVGKQIYDCNGVKFVLREPAAGLFTSRGIPAAIHGKGPFWTNFDGSRVDGFPLDPTSASVPSPDPAPPAPAKNISWLKLAATPTPNTTGVFSNVKFIQRIDTRGGVAPASCAAPNTTLAVDYTANYVFWAPK